jgi:phosphomannomutase
MILKLLQEFSQTNTPVSDFIKPYQKYYHSGEINFTVADKETIFKKIEVKYSKGKINKLDGITIEYPNFWFNLRGSNTEPKIRLNLEAITKKIMQEKTNELKLLIKQTKEVNRGKSR